MVWLKGVKVLFAFAGTLLVGVWVALINDAFGWGVVLGVIAAMLFIIGCRRIQQLCEHDEPYKNVTFYCLRESPTVWSTHIGGWPQQSVQQFWRRLKSALMSGPGSVERMTLVLDSIDRLEIRRRSLDCFARKLDQLSQVENAVLITASVLNDPVRTNRLELRMQEIEKRPEWSYQLIERKLGVFVIMTGRLFYGWTFPRDRGWCPYAPGLIAWRKGDNVPQLKRFNAKPW